VSHFFQAINAKISFFCHQKKSLFLVFFLPFLCASLFIFQFFFSISSTYKHENKYIDVTLKMRVSSYKYIETANLYFGETVGIAKIEKEISKNASLLNKKESKLLILILFSTVCVSIHSCSYYSIH
jgi:hypothetical protein